MPKAYYPVNGSYKEWTPDMVGAAASSHTHAKADVGLSNVDNTADTNKSVKYATSAGSATTATQLSSSAGSTTQPVYFSNGKPVAATAYSSASVNYANSSGWTKSLNGVARYISTDTNTVPYYRIATVDTNSSYMDASLVLSLDQGYRGSYFGICRISMRTDDIASGQTGSCHGAVEWLVNNGIDNSKLFCNIYSKAGTTCYVDLYFKATSSYEGVNFRVISNGSRGSNGGSWVLTGDEPRAAADIRTYTQTNVTASNVGRVNHANSADSASSVVWTNVSGRPSSMPASDVSSWAKASSKPSYSWSEISSKPTFSTVATSGSYNDLSNKPTIPSVGNGTITVTQGGTSKGSFTLNQSGNATIALNDTNTWRGVQNNLTSTATDQSLSAAQGKILNDKLNSLITISSTQPTSNDCKIWIKI